MNTVIIQEIFKEILKNIKKDRSDDEKQALDWAFSLT